jgi:hypothetical protein
MATLISTPFPFSVPAEAQQPSSSPAPFLVCEHSEGVAVELSAPARLLGQFGPFAPQTTDGRAAFTLHAYTLRSIRTCVENKVTPWRNNQLLGERFVELSLHVGFEQNPGRLLIHRWTTARTQSLIAARPFGVSTTHAQIQLERLAGASLLLISTASACLCLELTRLQDRNAPVRSLNLADAYSLDRATARRFRQEFTGLAAQPVQGKLTDASLLTGIFNQAPFDLISAATMSDSYSSRTSLPQCVNGAACAHGW